MSLDLKGVSSFFPGFGDLFSYELSTSAREPSLTIATSAFFAVAGLVVHRAGFRRLGISLFALGIAACGSSKSGRSDAGTSACADIDCGVGGECVVVRGAARCYTPTPYPDAGSTPDAGEKGPCQKACLDENTLRSCLPNGDEMIAECGAEASCEEDYCRTVPPEDLCPPGTGAAFCRITDSFDLVEDLTNANKRGFLADNLTASIKPDICAEDDAFRIGKSQNEGPTCDIALHARELGYLMAIDPPPLADYYRIEAKMRWGAVLCSTDPFRGVLIHFGDNRPQEFVPGDDLTECIFQPVVNPTTERITTPDVRVRMERLGGGYIDFMKTRIWSCRCE